MHDGDIEEVEFDRLAIIKATESPRLTPRLVSVAASRVTCSPYSRQETSRVPPSVRSAMRSGMRATVSWNARHSHGVSATTLMW
jgi:hypothetical protein